MLINLVVDMSLQVSARIKQQFFCYITFLFGRVKFWAEILSKGHHISRVPLTKTFCL